MRGRYNTGDEDNLAKQVADLKKRVADLEAGSRIGSTSVDKGTLRVNSGSFQVGVSPSQMYFGPVVAGAFGVEGAGLPSGTTPGWIYRRADGTVVFALSGTGYYDQYWGFYDNKQNLVISDDGFTNQGLARPYIPIVFAENSTFAFNINTTSATFVGLWNARYTKQHPRVRVQVLVKCSDGTTGGELRLMNLTTGAQIGTTVTIPIGSFTIFDIGPDAINTPPVVGNHMSVQELEVQARVTAGAGNIGAKIYAAYGEQS